MQGEEVAEDVVNMDSSEDSSEDEKTNSWTWLHRESSKLKAPKPNSETILDSTIDKAFPKVESKLSSSILQFKHFN